MPLTPGTRLGPYEIGAPVGRGGMGEVYRARDTRLNRDVAVKILPDAFAVDPDRVARFTREAQTLAALNHSHIAQIFGVEETSGLSGTSSTRALVMEFVEGETLAERLARGPIAIDEALRLARQIADALEAAHDAGIVHRDLKPANIKVRTDDTVKVLDFGLAKPGVAGGTGAAGVAGAAGGTGASDSPTLTSPALTETGVLLGTAAYMSPEQARGKPVDRRTDIWAFGCVLYEMLTGKRTFAAGDNLSDTIAAVLTSEVEWTALPSTLPPRIQTLLRRCLQRDAQKRLPHIGLARLEIDDAAGEFAAGPAAPVRTAPIWKRAAPAAVTAVVVGAFAAFAGWVLKPPPAAVVTRFSMTLPDGHDFTGPGRQVIAVSPDGLHIVYVANRRLYVRALWDAEPKAIAGTEGDQAAFQPVFSPDGRALAFVVGQEVKRIALTGGTAATVASLGGGVYGMSWTGEHLVFGDGGTKIVRVAVAGGTPEVLVSVEKPEMVSSPSLLPGGTHLLFSHSRLTNPRERWTKAHVVVQSLATGERKIIVDGGADGRYLSSGHLVYAVGGVVYGAPFDLERLAIRGTPEPVIEGLRRGGPTGAAQFAVAPTGSLAYLPGTPSSPLESELFLTDRSGKTVRLNVRGGQYEQPRLSPDGTQLAVSRVDPQLTSVWVYELSGASALRRLTTESNNKYPVWSADGQRIVFQSDREGDLALFWQRADGTGTAERLTRADQGAAHIPHSSSPDGRHLLYSEAKGTAATLWAYSFQDRKTQQLAGVTSRNPLDATFSPDGRWVAYHSTSQAEKGGTQILVMPFPPDGTTHHVGGGIHTTWSADGRQLVGPLTEGRMGVITISSTQPAFTFGNPVFTSVPAIGATGIEAPRGFDIGRDGTMVGVITAGNLEALGDNREIRVVLNWYEELKRLVPTR